MNDSIDPRIKREFDALIYSVLDSDALVNSVINRLHQRRRKLIVKITAGLSIFTLLVAASYFLYTNGTFNSPNVINVQTKENPEGSGLLKLPVSTLLDVDGNDPGKSTFDFKVRLAAGQSILFWTSLRGLAVGTIGTMTASAQMPDGKFKDFQIYQIGGGTNRQEIGARGGDGVYRFRLAITDKSVRGKIELAITPIN